MMRLTRFAYFPRLLVGIYQRSILSLENKELLCFLHIVIAFVQMDSSYSNFSSGNLKLSAYYQNVWEIQRIAFTMIGEVYFRAGASLTVDIWQSTIEVGVLVFIFFMLVCNKVVDESNRVWALACPKLIKAWVHMTKNLLSSAWFGWAQVLAARTQNFDNLAAHFREDFITRFSQFIFIPFCCKKSQC